MKRIFLIIIILSLTFGATATAATAQIISAEVKIGVSDTVLISGVSGEAKINEEISIRVLNPGRSLSEISANNGAAQYISSELTDENGKFEFGFTVIPTSSAGGEYTLYFTGDNFENLGLKLWLSSLAEREDLRQRLVAAANGGGITQNLMAECGKTFALSSTVFGGITVEKTVYDKLNLASLGDRVTYNLQKQPTNGQTVDALIGFIQKIAVLEAFNQAKSDVVFENGLLTEQTGLKSIDTEKNVTVYSYYSTKLTETGIQKVNSSLLNKGFADFDVLKKAFAEFVVCLGTGNNKIGGRAHIKPLLTENAQYVGLNLSAYNALSDNERDIVDIGLAGAGDFASISALQVKLDALIASVKAAPSNTPTQIGGGGGGSSGGGGGTGFNLDSDYQNDLLNNNQSQSEIFIDLSEATWARNAVLSLYEKNVIAGDGQGRFRPNDSVTREEFAKMLVLAFDKYENYSETNFSDISPNAWYIPYIESAYRAKISTGYDDGRFGIGDLISRQDAAVMLYRIIKSGAFSDEITDFTDIGDIADYAATAVSKLTGAGIINGMGDGSFAPKEGLTRAQAAVLIYRGALYE